MNQKQSEPVSSRPTKTAYELKVTLQDSDPAIWRRVFVMADATLLDLHAIIQIAVGWKNCHLHLFRVGEEKYSDPEFDLALEWGEPIGDEGKAELRDVVKRKGDRIIYEYDFGDSWDHVVEVEAIRRPRAKQPPRCLDGARACPPEDVGGIPGYADFLDAIADPEHERHKDYLGWVGGIFDPEAFDRKAINQILRYPWSWPVPGSGSW